MLSKLARLMNPTYSEIFLVHSRYSTVPVFAFLCRYVETWDSITGDFTRGYETDGLVCRAVKNVRWYIC